MKKVSDETKNRTLVIGTVPCGLMTVAAFGALLVGLLLDWEYSTTVAVSLIALVFLWGALFMSVFTVMEFWPQDD